MAPRAAAASSGARRSDPTALVEAALAGDRLALARILTAVENRTPVAEAALRRSTRSPARAHLVGITGPPGSGKSTLVSALIGAARKRDAVAVVAVDPSSPITGGALLGDRVRMQSYATDRDVFIRSMAARGHAGGLASTSTAAAAVLDAAGFDLILLETVGTGQSEVEVAAAADTTVVLEAPEMGDEIQAIKAGLLEVADIVVVNKGDRPGAQRTASQLRAMLVAVGRAGASGAAAAFATPVTPGPSPPTIPPLHVRDRRNRRFSSRRRPPATESRAPRNPGPAPRARPRVERYARPARARRGAGLGDPRRPAPGDLRVPANRDDPRRRCARSPRTASIRSAPRTGSWPPSKGMTEPIGAAPGTPEARLFTPVIRDALDRRPGVLRRRRNPPAGHAAVHPGRPARGPDSRWGS